jgi:hypothetical protein
MRCVTHSSGTFAGEADYLEQDENGKWWLINKDGTRGVCLYTNTTVHAIDNVLASGAWIEFDSFDLWVAEVRREAGIIDDTTKA